MECLARVSQAAGDELGVTPYVVFHDATLREMLEQRPTTSHMLLSITGVGESKLNRFGEAFLDVIRDFEYPAVE